VVVRPFVPVGDTVVEPVAEPVAVPEGPVADVPVWVIPVLEEEGLDVYEEVAPEG
jgi:hypothetical protein